MKFGWRKGLAAVELLSAVVLIAGLAMGMALMQRKQSQAVRTEAAGTCAGMTQLACQETPGCKWGPTSTVYNCSGSPPCQSASCGIQTNYATCSSSWIDLQCTSHSGCTVNQIPRSCSGLSESDCRANIFCAPIAQACSFVSGTCYAGCAYTPAQTAHCSCSGITDQYECQFNNCTWFPAKTASCTGSYYTGCSGSWTESTGCTGQYATSQSCTGQYSVTTYSCTGTPLPTNTPIPTNSPVPIPTITVGVIPYPTLTYSSRPQKSVQQVGAENNVDWRLIDAVHFIETIRSGSGAYCQTCVNPWESGSDPGCGPMQIGTVAFRSVASVSEWYAQTGGFNRCYLPDAWELAARVLQLKAIAINEGGNSWRPNYPVTYPNDLSAISAYNGTGNCNSNNRTVCRWGFNPDGTGFSYCDAARNLIEVDPTGNSLPIPQNWCLNSAKKLELQKACADIGAKDPCSSSNMVISSPSPAPTGVVSGFAGQYYPNKTLSGSPTVTRTDSAINFNWASGSPASGIGIDYFSVRWTRTVSFPAGMYRFTTITDDGVRLKIDGATVIDKWLNQPATSYSVDRTLAAGNHTVIMEYYENTGAAVAKLVWTLVGGATPTPTRTPTPAPSTTNLLKNAGFESDPWVNYFTHTDGTATFTWDQTGGRTGKAVKIVSTGSSTTALSRWLTKNYPDPNSIPTTAGKSYTGSVYVKTTGVTNTATLTVLFLENGTNIYKAGKSVSTTDTGGVWKSLSVTSPAAPANTYVRFEMRLNGPGTAWFDDATLK